MHARHQPRAVAVAQGLNHLVIVVGAFFFALAMAAVAVQGTGPRTVEVNFPHRAELQTGPTAPLDAAPPR
ncbi:hypothetical protein [Sporichthya polymorpha]|uniref:hypothetical protein n=1 Tax=Sporichthya polymorpha TaxID=35751 RepID=UPI0012EC7F2E|nr:hypothetical protein [Sporichthya polymorpha]